MSKVSLRVYNREIEGMIEGGQLEEAVAHCQYILKTFPMHVETYRLLGKSFLEARRYTDAADIFQRALMAVPDDFVAHVGMSIIRDDEGKLDDAIWHMERAFEAQPSNPAIQGELRRLYGRRDGVEPHKIRLSRDALANMYAQGELFNQAIAEIRAVLAEDANRLDLQVMLARAYYRSGQKVEAAEMAANLLKKYKYCLDALRILVDVLPGSARTENTQVYRQRLHLLDPYSSFATESVFNTDQVPDTAVSLERLEYTASTAPAAPQPNWASSLGIKLTDEKHAEPPPDWLKTGESSESFAASSPVSSGPSAPAADDKSVPDWMRSSGWQESSDKAQEGLEDSSVEQPAEQLAKADIPDWLKAMAPQEMTDAGAGSKPTPANPPASGAGDIPDWLAGIGTVAAVANAGSEPAKDNLPPSGEGEVPNWLAESGADAAKVNAGLEATATNLPASGKADLPDSLADTGIVAGEESTGPSQPATPPQDNDAFPDWLKDMDKNASAETSAGIAAGALEQPQAEPQPASTEPAQPATADQTAIEPTVSASHLAEDASFQPTGESKPLKIEDDTMAWLESLAAKQGAKEEELLTKPEDRSEEIPDWLRPTGEQPVAPVTPEPTPTPNETLPLEPLTLHTEELAVQEPVISEELPPMPTPTEGSPQPVKIEDATMAWLEGLAAKQGAKEEELLSKPEDRSEEIPDWLRSVAEQPSTTATTEASQAPRETLPLEALSLHTGEPATQGQAPSDELPATPENGLEDIPDWLRSTNEQLASPATLEPVSAAGENLPLEGLSPHAGEFESREQVPSEELPAATENRLEDIPDWLRPADEQAATPATPKPSPALSEAPSIELQPPLAGEMAIQEPAPSKEPQTLATPTEGADQPVKVEDETMAWLEDLETSQGAKPDESQTSPIERSGTLPDWIQEMKPEPVAPDVLPAPETPQEDISITSWLSKMDVEETLGKSQPAPDASQPAVAPSSELPDWLKELEKPAAHEEAPKPAEDLPDWLRQPVQPADNVAAATLTPETAPELELPAWVDEETPVSEQPAATTPGEWIPVDEKPSPTQVAEQEAEPAAVVIKIPVVEPKVEPAAVVLETPVIEPKVEPAEVILETPVVEPSTETAAVITETPVVEPKVEPAEIALETPVVEPSAEPAAVVAETPVQPKVPKGTGMLARIPAKEKDAEFLAAAQAALDANKLNEAMQGYSALIKKNRLPDEVIHDLREAIYRFPVDIIVWQTLGDAYMRANRLQDALDAYTKAEELLR